MKRGLFISILGIVIGSELIAQTPKISKDWEQMIQDEFPQADKGQLLNLDYSDIISNQLRFKGDPWSTYIGVFGPKNKRIDFHITATKFNEDTYSIKGKSRLGNNIRELKGEIKLKQAFKVFSTEYLMTFEYQIKEPGDKDGDGMFTGIGSFVFGIKDNQADIYWSESGDFRQFNNMFVGVWQRYNSEKSMECIFSFDVSGTYTKLPYRDNFYKEFGDEDECKCSYQIREEFNQHGWLNYNKTDGQKDNWWN